MAKTKEQKKQSMESLDKLFKTAKSIVFVNFHGFSVDDTTKMRKKLREEGIGYVVIKKTLAKLALKKTPFKGDVPEFLGELAIAHGSDDVAPAREVYSFQKEHKDSLTILGGVFEGKYMDKGAMTDIAQIPNMEVLRGQFVNIINSPIQRLVIAIGEIAKAQ